MTDIPVINARAAFQSQIVAAKHRTLHPDAARALGNLLVTQRGKLSKTQQEVADFVGISRQHYRTLELGGDDFGTNRTSNPTISLVIDLAAALQLDPATIVEIVLKNHGTVEKTPAKPSSSESEGRQ